MSNLEKIQKGMKGLQIIFRIILVLMAVGVILTSVAAVLVASDVLNVENQFFHLLSDTAGMSKKHLVGILAAAGIALLFGCVIILLSHNYCLAELKEGTPFTNAGADRIRRLGIITIVVSLVSSFVAEGICKIMGLTEWDTFGSGVDITFGICLILLSVVFRYGAELEQKIKEQ